MSTHPQLRADLLRSPPLAVADDQSLAAVLDAQGRYHALQFVLRLSPLIHRTLEKLPHGIVSSADIDFDGAQAFSTYLHETIHWWQHIGTTYGLMRSLTYPTQAHANYQHLKQLIAMVGFKKPIYRLASTLGGPSEPDTAAGRSNVIVNNHFDFAAFRGLTFNHAVAKRTAEHPLFESVGHAFQVGYANNILVLGSVVDPEGRVLPHPKAWETAFGALRDARKEGFYYGSPIKLWPVGAHEIMEGQACFGQLQYLAFASGGQLGWDEFRALGMLHGVYLTAFEAFLKFTKLDWPPTVHHPTVALFLLVCDMALNSGAGFPHPLRLFESFITDTDPGARFTMLATLARLKCPQVLTHIRSYSREEYLEVCEALADAMLVDTPMAIAKTCAGWAAADGPFASLMQEHATYAYDRVNMPVRVLFSHFLDFMRDRVARPEFFCWPGAWMAGDRISADAEIMLDRHGALFIDKADDDGVFPRLRPDRPRGNIDDMFNRFYAANMTYDLTGQWIMRPGPFVYDYRWLSQTGTADEIKRFADDNFESVYGLRPDAATIL